MPWFVKIEEGKVDKSTFDQHVSTHHAYVRGLIAKGHRVRSGYWAQQGGWNRRDCYQVPLHLHSYCLEMLCS